MSKSVFNGWEYPSVKTEPPNERFLKIIMSPEVSGYEAATILLAHIPPGSTTGKHTHESDEIIYVIGRGKGLVGGKVTNLETDSVIYAPRGVEHECRNSSETETLKLFCVFIPPLKPTPIIEKLITKTKDYLGKQR